MLTSCFLVAVLSAGDAGADPAAPAGPGSEASVAYRNEATKRFEAPSAAAVKEMAARAQAEAPAAPVTPAVEELAALGLREEAVAVRAGGVKLRLRGGLRSALLAEERDGRIVLTCEEAPAAAADSSKPVTSDEAEVRP